MSAGVFMRRDLLGRVLLSVLVLFVLAGLNLWGWRPFVTPDAVENGDVDEEVQLAPQRISAQAKASVSTAAVPGKFGGNPYLIGAPIVTTSTIPELETNIAINPMNSSNFVGIITDYSLRPGGDLTNGVSKYTISNDGGNTWSDQFVPVKNNAYPQTSDGVSWLVDRDPGIGIDRQGNIYFSGLYLKLAPTNAVQEAVSNSISRSTSPGGVYVCAGTLPNVTLTSAQCRPVFTYTKATGNTTSVDRDWMAVDAGSTSSFEGNVYIVWTHYTGCHGNTCQAKFIAFSRSTDHGVTWSPILQVSAASHTIVDWPMVTVGDDGTVYVAYQFYMQNQNQRQHFLAVSTDGGATFSTPVAMTPVFTNVTFNCPYRKNSAPNVVVSPVAGAEYVYDVWAEQAGSGSNIVMARSRQTKGNGGFTTPVTINDSNAGQREYAAAAVDGNGTLHTLFLDTRNSPSDTSLYDVYATYSKNLGANFTPNARVSPTTINGNTTTIGDFFGLTVEPTTGVAHATYSNGGLINGQLITTTMTPQ